MPVPWRGAKETGRSPAVSSSPAARRVVASQWLVDDEAGGIVVTRAVRTIAESLGRDAEVDYATAWHAAKLALRQDERWKNPYFWGTLVLVGPR